MWPADPAAALVRDPTDALTSTTSGGRASTGRDAFRAAVARRDGARCVVSGLAESFCVAAHVVPRVKGDAVCVWRRHSPVRSSPVYSAHVVFIPFLSFYNFFFLRK